MHTINSLAKANKIAVRTVASLLEKEGIVGTPTNVGSRTIVLYGEDAVAAVERKAAAIWSRREELRARRARKPVRGADDHFKALYAKVEAVAADVKKLIDLIGLEQ